MRIEQNTRKQMIKCKNDVFYFNDRFSTVFHFGKIKTFSKRTHQDEQNGHF